MTTADSAQDATALRMVESAQSGKTSVRMSTSSSDGATPLSPAVVALLRQVLENVVAGVPVDVVPRIGDMTTQQAADVLNVSRPYVVKLIDSGEIPYHFAGTHRRVKSSDVLSYKIRRGEKASQAADELIALSEDLGLYD